MLVEIQLQAAHNYNLVGVSFCFVIFPGEKGLLYPKTYLTFDWSAEKQAGEEE